MTQKPLRIIILFQGKKGNDIYDKIKKETEIGKIQVKFFNPIDGQNGMGSTIYSKVKKDIEDADAAIALVTDDKRDTIKAGNLWMEIGLFLGTRDNNLIYLFLDEVLRKPDGAINIISDITTDYDDFNNADDLLNKFEKIIPKIFSDVGMKKNDFDRKNKKKKIAISLRSAIWENYEAYKCEDYRVPCKKNLYQLSFSSEMIAIIVEMELLLLYKILIVQIQRTARESKYFLEEYEEKNLLRAFATLFPTLKKCYTDFEDKTDYLFRIGEYFKIEKDYKEQVTKYYDISDHKSKVLHRIRYFTKRCNLYDDSLKSQLDTELLDFFFTLEKMKGFELSNLFTYQFGELQNIFEKYQPMLDLSPCHIECWDKVINNFRKWHETFSSHTAEDIDSAIQFHSEFDKAESHFPHNNKSNGYPYIDLWQEKCN